MIDDRLGILLFQLDSAWDILKARLVGLTDGEYYWEPAPGCWSLRRRGEGVGLAPAGKGEWRVDADRAPRHPPPLTTIAWRMCHIAVSPLLRYDWTFGPHSLELDDIVWPATAGDAIAFVAHAHDQWRGALGTVGSEDLDTIGFSQFPHGLDPQVRFADLLAWTNLEFTHHAAEIACLRDLYRARGGEALNPPDR